MLKDHPLILRLNDGLKSFFKLNTGTTKMDKEAANSNPVTDPVSATIARKAAAAPRVPASMLLDLEASHAASTSMPPTNTADGKHQTGQDSAMTDPSATHSSRDGGASP